MKHFIHLPCAVCSINVMWPEDDHNQPLCNECVYDELAEAQARIGELEALLRRIDSGIKQVKSANRLITVSEAEIYEALNREGGSDG